MYFSCPVGKDTTPLWGEFLDQHRPARRRQRQGLARPQLNALLSATILVSPIFLAFFLRPFDTIYFSHFLLRLLWLIFIDKLNRLRNASDF